MRKIISISVAAGLMLCLMANAVWGNSSTIRAENGRVLPPAGFGLNVNGNPANLANFDAQISYGITPALTIAGDWTRRDQTGDLAVKALFSPVGDKGGYTAYGEYRPATKEFTDYGITFWNNLGFIYAFVNLDSCRTAADKSWELRLTPGVNLRLTSRIKLAAELAVQPDSWKLGEARVGVIYQLADRFSSKFMVSQDLRADNGLTYSAGVALEI
jgi:hypothetical protein